LETPDGINMLMVDLLARLHANDIKGGAARLEQVRHILEEMGALETMQGAMFCSACALSGMAQRKFEYAFRSSMEASRITAKLGTLKGSLGAFWMSNLATTRMLATKDADASFADLQKGFALIRNGDAGQMKTPDHAFLLLQSARLKNICGQLFGARADAEQAREIYEKLGGVEFGLHGGGLMLSLGVFRFKGGDESGAIEAFEEGMCICIQQGTLEFWLHHVATDVAADEAVAAKLRFRAFQTQI
jgi:hypothetical protein